MSVGNRKPIVVSYRGISSTLTEKVMTEAVGQLEEDEGTPAQRAALLAGFGQALRAIELEDKKADPDVLVVPRNRLASLMMSRLAENPPEGNIYEELEAGGVELKFAVPDAGVDVDAWGWFKSLFSWVRKSQYHPLVPPPDGTGPTELPQQARVALLGDWGTGLYGAVPCAESIQRDPERFDLLMHLGDVYYAGTNDEVQERFSSLWPNREDAISRAINANHEMYSGGHAYFKKILPAFQQGSSYFALQNDHWLLVGLDVAHTAHDIDAEQVRWLDQLIKAAGDRRVLLFSHHQLFSRFDSQGVELAKKLGKILESGKVLAWYWGHEHRCALYEPDPRYGNLLGRCLGHGGMPYSRKPVKELPVDHTVGDSIWRRFDAKNMVPGGLVLDGPNPYIKGKETKYGPHGYMTLELEDRHLTEVIYTAAGEETHRKEIGG